MLIERTSIGIAFLVISKPVFVHFCLTKNEQKVKLSRYADFAFAKPLVISLHAFIRFANRNSAHSSPSATGTTTKSYFDTLILKPRGVADQIEVNGN